MRLSMFAALALVACTPLVAATPDLASAAPDMAACQPDPTFKSDCGKPCDKGNSKGVGMFCRKISDCKDNSDAFLCTVIGDPNNFFCTMGCKANGPADACGENARCACQGGSCGCFPTACDVPTDMRVGD